MRRMRWTAATALVLGTIFGVTLLAGERPQPGRLVVEPVSLLAVSETQTEEIEVEQIEILSVGSVGSALASAAFGLDALQPETYNGEIVLDIIDASPLAGADKRRLVAGLEAAEAGRAELHRVLSDVRYALAVE